MADTSDRSDESLALLLLLHKTAVSNATCRLVKSLFRIFVAYIIV